MPEDLTTTEQGEQEAEFEMPTPHDDIAAALNAMIAVNDIDFEETKVSEQRKRKIAAIKRMAVDIIYEQLKYIKECIFFEEKNDEEED